MSSESKIYYKTPIGTAEIIGSPAGVQKISILETEGETSVDIPDFLQECVQQLEEYFFQERKEFSFKMDLKGTDFQKRVWNALLEIPFGETISYAEQSERLGDLKAIRAVASANGKNPIWLAIPCHRVIGKNGELTGYAGGIWRKKWLLEKEGGILKQFSLFE